MWNGAYYIIVVIVAVWGILTGYRKGLLRQAGGVLGVAFGIAATRMLSPDFADAVDGWVPSWISGFNRPFVVDTLACGIVYILSSGFISLCTMPLGRIIGILGAGVLDSIGGAVFRLFQVLMVLSIVYNLLVALSPTSDLTRSSNRHDGNIVEGVMKIAPPILGFPGAEEVAYRQQLEDARKIS